MIKIMPPPEGVDVPGPVDWQAASHWIVYDHDLLTVQTWCKTGPDYRFRLMTRIRPMSRSEVIHSKLRDYTREDVLKAFGVVEEHRAPLPQPRFSWWDIRRFF